MKEGKLFVGALAGLLFLNVVLLGVCDTPPPPRPVPPPPPLPRPEIRPPVSPTEPLPPGEELNPPCISWSLLAWGCWNGMPPAALTEAEGLPRCLTWARPH